MVQQKTPTTALGTENITKLLTQYAVPAIIAMTAASLYNMIDSIFIGRGVGTMAISGLALTFPLINLAAAFGAMVGMGATTLISVKLGQKDHEGANRVLGNVIMLNIIIGIGFCIPMLIFLDPILYFFGASEQTIGYARDYMQIILLGNVVTHIYLGLNAVLRATGYPQKAMISTISTVVINGLLNAVFIFGLDMGIRGAAIATILAQVIMLVWQVKHFMNPNSFMRFHKRIFRMKAEIVKATIAIGMAPFMMNLCACLIVILINQGFKEHGGDLAIGAYGIVNRIAFLFVMIVMGINQGMQPIIGYNYGARRFLRVRQTLKLGIIGATVVMMIGFLIGELLPAQVASIFTSDEELIRQSVVGLRIAFMLFPIIGFQMVATNFFQSIGKAKASIFLSLTRQLLFMIPCLLILPRFFGTNGIWASIPVADLMASLVAGWVLYAQFKKFKVKHEQEMATINK